MKLAFCVITKGDEELESLKGLLKSVNGVFDTYHITANGENTKETEAWCRKQGVDYTYLKWNDSFAEQRNFNFSQVPSNTDYIVWADSDDVIINAHIIRDVARIAQKQDYDAVFFSYWYGNKFDGKPSAETFVECELSQERERLIKPGKTVWKKRDHETPVPVDGANFRYSQVPYSKEWPIVWLHLGADRDMTQEELNAKMQRNQRLLEMELEDERREGEADPRTLLYLMKIYAESEEKEYLEKCIEMGKEYLMKSGWDQERAVCLQLMSRCMTTLGQDEQAKDLLLDALGQYPYNPLLYLYLARACFNLGDYRQMKHWMTLGLNLNTDDTNTSMHNILELKVLSSELMLQYYMHAEKDVRKAWESARMLNKVNPTEQNNYNEEYLYNQKELDIASEHAHMIMKYLSEIGREDDIPKFIEALPNEIQRLPFAIKYYNRYKAPRIWGENEVCYFANFGGAHFEKWDGNSIERGIGGSETAVIKLAEEWVRRGYRVVVYGDPEQEITINGVEYVPYYKFNQKDKFNIFVQWRHNSLAGKVSAKKFLVDLHDIFFEETHKDKLDQIDKFMVKSKYHRELAQNFPDDKFLIVSNGI